MIFYGKSKYYKNIFKYLPIDFFFSGCKISDYLFNFIKISDNNMFFIVVQYKKD